MPLTRASLVERRWLSWNYLNSVTRCRAYFRAFTFHGRIVCPSIGRDAKDSRWRDLRQLPLPPSRNLAAASLKEIAN